ncbi:MAG: hypothetical protein QOJ02_4188 [Acidobacteriota bacterium]|jgi:hypothetical protein|nr:hypothetical protein [Acidobacteriota bacterium]
MRLFILPLTLTAALLSGACGSSNQSKSDTGTQPPPTATIKQPSQSTATTPTGDAPPVAVAHGGAPPSSGPSGSIDTSALDKKIEQAETKAKAPGAKQADKLAAATAYLERANIFYSAGQPTLYKFALRDFRRTLRYDPNNAEARDKQDQIVQIYQQMGRPVPELGNEP